MFFHTPCKEQWGIFILRSWGHVDIAIRLPSVHWHTPLWMWGLLVSNCWNLHGCITCVHELPKEDPGLTMPHWTLSPEGDPLLTTVSWGCSGSRDNFLLWNVEDNNFLTSVLFVLQGFIHFDQIIVFSSHTQLFIIRCLDGKIWLTTALLHNNMLSFQLHSLSLHPPQDQNSRVLPPWWILSEAPHAHFCYCVSCTFRSSYISAWLGVWS